MARRSKVVDNGEGAVSASDPALVVASSIRAVRRRRSMTLAELAAKIDLDKGYLSRIERGQKSPSVSTLLKVAQALGVQIGQLFGESIDDEAITVVRRDEYISVAGARRGDDTGVSAILHPTGHRRISAFLLEPGREQETRNADHPGDEMLFVLDGGVEVVFSDRTITLGPGDCVQFDGHLRHLVRKVGNKAARALIVVAQDLEKGGKE